MLIKLAWRNLWRNRKRSIITLTSIAIAVLLAVSMRSMQLGMYDNMIKNVVGSYVGYIQIHGRGYWEEQTLDNALQITPQLRDKVQSIPGVKHLIERIGTFSLGSRGDETKGVMVSGIRMEDERQMVDWDARLLKGELLPPGSEDILLAKGVARFFRADVGDTIVLIGQGYHGMSAAGKFRVGGIVDMKNPKINSVSVFLSLPVAQDYLSAKNVVTHLVIDKAENADEKQMLNRLTTALDTSKYEVMGWREMLPELEQTILADSVGGLLMVFILYMIITFGIFGTVLMMTQERIFELGIMMAIGMKRLKLILTLIYETIILTILGLLIGIALVLPIMYYYHVHPLQLGLDQAEVMEKFGFEATVPFLFNLQLPLTHALIIFIISLVIALYPVIRIWRLNPLEAMRSK